jgi:ABC-2 type transport system ATP-binding protein
VNKIKPTSAAIEFRGVSKTYGSKLAVDGLDLCFHAGSLTALLGENGAGKTTSISMALGLVKPSKGAVTVGGDAAGSIEARQQIGAMLQSAELPEMLTVREHILLFQTYYPAPLSLPALSEMLGLQDILNKRYGTLSGGQRRRAQLALALCGNADFILLDEPTVGLDIDARHMFWRLIRDLVKAGRGVILTTHYLEEADALADRILVMAEGRIIADGTPAEIKAKAGGKLVDLRTDAPDAVLLGLPGTEKLTHVGDRVQLVTHDAEGALEALFASGHGVADLSINRAGLEAAFLGLTQQK